MERALIVELWIEAASAAAAEDGTRVGFLMRIQAMIWLTRDRAAALAATASPLRHLLGSLAALRPSRPSVPPNLVTMWCSGLAWPGHPVN